MWQAFLSVAAITLLHQCLKRNLSDRNVLVLIRTYDPTPAMVQRIHRWSRSLHPEYTMCVSIDTSSRQDVVGLFEGLQVHQYTEEDMQREYPALRGRETGMPSDWRDFVGPNCHIGPWGFHVEAINLCFRSLNNWWDYDWVWVLEDDVGVAGGSLQQFLDQYDRDDTRSDLISQTLICPSHDWVWINQGSQSYLDRIPMHSRVVSPEHVQRLSRRLLEELHQLSKEDGCLAWSEQSTPSLCLQLGLRFRKLRGDTVGMPFSFDGRVARDAFWRVDAACRREGKQRVLHALKF